MPLYGFSFLRNAIKFDYPFRESLQSLAAATDAQLLALGRSEDGTENAIAALQKDLPRLQVLPTVWDDALKTGGLILSQQTNVALNALRAESQKESNAWGLYLQADELIHERDIPQIRQDFSDAEAQGCDVVVFRYIHFWHSFDRIAINKKWYSEEIRGVRLHSETESWGDAQSFRRWRRRFYSDVPIYHYGHVKDPNAYQQKIQYFVELHHDQDANAKRRSLAKEARPQEAIPYRGSHPQWIRSKVPVQKKTQQLLFWTDDPAVQGATQRLEGLSGLKPVSFWSALRTPGDKCLMISKSRPIQVCLDLLRRSHVPRRMRARGSRPWPQHFWLTLRFSELHSSSTPET